MEEDLYVRATIGFREPMNPVQFRGFARTLCSRLNCRINYASEECRLIEAEKEEKTSAKVSGMISKLVAKEVIVLPFESFRENPRVDDYGRFEGIRFILPPGYSCSEISQANLTFMDSVREIACAYRSRKK